MPKSKASKEPPKVKEEEQIPESEVESPPQNEEVVEETPVIETPPVIVELPIEAHLAQIVIENFGDDDSDPLFTGCRAVTYHGGHTYTGDFENGKMHGEGEYTWSHGLVYKGEFKDNVVSGRGEYTWPDGSVYKGDVENGLRHGRGTFCCADNATTYTGDWVYGKRTGSGKMTYDKDELSYYIGEWLDNKKCGRGFRQYPSGSTYDGEWQDNFRHGDGTMQWHGTGECYTGQWFMGIQHGEGTQEWTVDSSSQLPLKNRYTGQWNNGRRHGFGVFTYASGARYEGDWVNNAKHGFGKFYFKDGSVFAGNFEKDSIVGRPGSPDMGKMMRSAVMTGRVSSPLHNHTKTSQSSFQLNIKSLVSDEVFLEEELRQVHNVLLRHITDLRRIYNQYCKIGDKGSGALMRMEFWKFLKDSLMYLRISMPDADVVISDAMEIECVTERQSPFTTFLFREFLQSLVFLSVHIYGKRVERVNGSYVAKCLSTLLQDHILSVDPNTAKGYSHSHQTNKQYVEQCWKIYQYFSQRKQCFTLREILFILKDIKLIGKTYPKLNVETVVQSIMLSVNENMQNDGALYLDIKINFFDFFNVLCGCALIIKHSSPLGFNIHSHLGTDTEVSGGIISISPDKTPLPESESPTKSLSKKNTPTETPLQTPVPSAVDERSDNNDPDGSTPLVDSVGSMAEEQLRDSPLLSRENSVDDRCGSFEDWESRIEDFFVCHFFPAAEKLMNTEKRISEEKRKIEEDRAELMEKERHAELAAQEANQNVPAIDIEEVATGDMSGGCNTSSQGPSSAELTTPVISVPN